MRYYDTTSPQIKLGLKMPNNSDLSAKQRRFIEEYLVDMNGTQAAIRAGYSPRSARVAASRLLMKDNIANALAERRAKISSKLEVTAKRVIAELAALGFANIADFYRENEDGTLAVDTDALLDPARAAAITQVDVQTAADGAQSIKIKLADKKAALVELGKHLGLFNERPEPLPAAEHDLISLRHQAMAICALFREAQLEAESGPQIDGESWIEDVALLSR